MSPALVHGKVDRWLLDHENWIAQGGATRLALCEDWRKVAVEFGAGHPAALGCLLALLREAWGHGQWVDVDIERLGPERYSLAVRVFDPIKCVWRYDGAVHGGWLSREVARPAEVRSDLDRPDYADALVSALEAAPRGELS
jgi:hypothetical protein